jgi:hypothetical protein
MSWRSVFLAINSIFHLSESFQSFLSHFFLGQPIVCQRIIFLNFLFVFLFFIIKVELLFTLGTEMIGILDDPLPEAFFMEEVLAREKGGFSHVLEADHTCIVMVLLDLLLINFF